MFSHKPFFPIALLGVLAIAFILGSKFSQFQARLAATEPILAEAGTAEKFAYLSRQQSNVCARFSPEQLSTFSADDRLQGACCAPMDLHRYQEQVESLKGYSNIAVIPPDPYDIPVAQALALLGYQESIKLTEEQQAIYDEAMKLSEEGGPCCCRCWRWDAFEGLAKFLITEYGFSAEQIAAVWDLEDGCGGAGHEHTT